MSLETQGQPFSDEQCTKDVQVSGVICDKRMAAQLKGKIYETAVRHAMMFRVSCSVKQTKGNGKTKQNILDI